MAFFAFFTDRLLSRVIFVKATEHNSLSKVKDALLEAFHIYIMISVEPWLSDTYTPKAKEHLLEKENCRQTFKSVLRSCIFEYRTSFRDKIEQCFLIIYL